MIENVANAKQRTSVLHAPMDIRLEERVIPEPKPGEVLVRVLAVGVCGSDVHYYRHGRVGDFVVTQPLVLGHEVGGEIVGVGEGVDKRRIGSTVALEPQRNNPWSSELLMGRYNLDPDIEFFATPPYDGAFCEYVTIPNARAFTVPDSMTVEEAALIEPLAVAVASVRHARIGLGDHVAVAGAGPIGLLIAQVARLAGATNVTVSDPLPGARSRALNYGATQVLDPMREDQALPDASFDVFLDASGVSAAIRSGIQALRPAGRALFVGMGADSIELPLPLIQVREIEMRGIFRYANAWPTSIELAASGQVDLSGLITAHFGLSKVADALDAASESEHVKVMVLPSERETSHE